MHGISHIKILLTVHTCVYHKIKYVIMWCCKISFTCFSHKIIFNDSFWVLKLCGFACWYRRFGSIWCLHLQDWQNYIHAEAEEIRKRKLVISRDGLCGMWLIRTTEMWEGCILVQARMKSGVVKLGKPGYGMATFRGNITRNVNKSKKL